MTKPSARTNKDNGPIDSADRSALFSALRARILKQKEGLNQQLMAGEIDNAEFASQVNGLLRKAMEDAAGIFDPPEFVEMFGVSPGAIPILMDPSISAREDKGPSEF